MSIESIENGSVKSCISHVFILIIFYKSSMLIFSYTFNLKVIDQVAINNCVMILAQESCDSSDKSECSSCSESESSSGSGEICGFSGNESEGGSGNGESGGFSCNNKESVGSSGKSVGGSGESEGGSGEREDGSGESEGGNGSSEIAGGSGSGSGSGPGSGSGSGSGIGSGCGSVENCGFSGNESDHEGDESEICCGKSTGMPPKSTSRQKKKPKNNCFGLRCPNFDICQGIGNSSNVYAKTKLKKKLSHYLIKNCPRNKDISLQEEIRDMDKSTKLVRFCFNSNNRSEAEAEDSITNNYKICYGIDDSGRKTSTPHKGTFINMYNS